MWAQKRMGEEEEKEGGQAFHLHPCRHQGGEAHITIIRLGLLKQMYLGGREDASSDSYKQTRRFPILNTREKVS